MLDPGDEVNDYLRLQNALRIYAERRRSWGSNKNDDFG